MKYFWINTLLLAWTTEATVACSIIGVLQVMSLTIRCLKHSMACPWSWGSSPCPWTMCPWLPHWFVAADKRRQRDGSVLVVETHVLHKSSERLGLFAKSQPTQQEHSGDQQTERVSNKSTDHAAHRPLLHRTITTYQQSTHKNTLLTIDNTVV